MYYPQSTLSTTSFSVDNNDGWKYLTVDRDDSTILFTITKFMAAVNRDLNNTLLQLSF